MRHTQPDTDPIGYRPETVMTKKQLSRALSCSLDTIESSDLPSAIPSAHRCRATSGAMSSQRSARWGQSSSCFSRRADTGMVRPSGTS
jgi:hypothetical protein